MSDEDLSYIETFSWLRAELKRLSVEADIHKIAMEPFINGERRSVYPIGSKAIIGLGQQLDLLNFELSQRLKGEVN